MIKYPTPTGDMNLAAPSPSIFIKTGQERGGQNMETDCNFITSELGLYGLFALLCKKQTGG